METEKLIRICTAVFADGTCYTVIASYHRTHAEWLWFFHFIAAVEGKALKWVSEGA